MMKIGAQFLMWIISGLAMAGYWMLTLSIIAPYISKTDMLNYYILVFVGFVVLALFITLINYLLTRPMKIVEA